MERFFINKFVWEETLSPDEYLEVVRTERHNIEQCKIVLPDLDAPLGAGGGYSKFWVKYILPRKKRVSLGKIRPYNDGYERAADGGDTFGARYR